ncbi:HAD family hydrolase [Cellulomonas sp. PhB143]|uniref:HAD family hydrolase n=1 Tax=Cellulomonas sp. PhB143 TaxID=2485186 RepID=UPI000F4997E5|nr:HAD family hydrolase [Cellulomonas sp. PhB143]ROS75405.1 HAD superfamily hydrolase (TIGR01509 family) [Cellulomonas sp. PhB143]
MDTDSQNAGTDAPVAVLLDVDGTLVDSNYLHVEAWTRALQDVGRDVAAWRVHRAIGMGSSELLEAVLGDDADAVAEQVKDAHSHYYAGAAGRLRAVDGARDLVRTLAARGIRPVLATSAAPDELERLRDVLDVEQELHAVTGAGDVDAAKPAPDLVQVALEAADVPAGRAVLVGDTVWDVEAAGRAGVACVAVRSGGIGVDELREAGAVAVYDDVADLLAHLDESPLVRLGG